MPNIRKHFPWDGTDWDDGYVSKGGRFLVYRPDYPRANGGGYAFRAHIVWWLRTGKVVPREMALHHINENKIDDRFENLMLMEFGEHTALHRSLPGVEIRCVGCGKPFRVPAWRLRSRAKRGGTVKFCSNACRCTGFRGGARERLVCVTGAGGFIGHWLVRYLKQRGYWVRAVDIKQPEFSPLDEADENWWGCDLRNYDNARAAVTGCSEVYALAATMGGIGFIGGGENDVAIMCDNTLININTLDAALQAGVQRYLFSSSACVYREDMQATVEALPLLEESAFPAMPDTPYGWEKLYTEILCGVYSKASDMKIRIARFHNIFGPEASYNDGREKLPAAACRKVAEASRSIHEGKETVWVDVWGDGKATRSFCYIDDCLNMLVLLMESDCSKPLNIGSDRAVSVDDVFDIVGRAAEVEVMKRYTSGPQGVRGRNADLSLMREVLGIEPKVSLEEGMGRLYKWVNTQMTPSLGVA